MLGVTSFTPYLPLGCALGAVILAWLGRFPLLSVVLVPLSLIPGQLLRFAVPGQGGGLLMSDAMLTALAGSFLATLLVGRHRGFLLSKLLLITPFFLIGLALLFLPYPLSLRWGELSIAVAYWLRLLMGFLYFILGWHLTRKHDAYRLMQLSWSFSYALLIALGYLQYLIFPNLTVLASQGWDPHQLRFFSTWLDPNFFGGFIALSLPYLFLLSYCGWRRRQPLIYLAWGFLTILSALALVLTESRSALVASAVASLILLPIGTWWLIRRRQPLAVAFLSWVLLMTCFLGVVWSLPLVDRFWGLISPDATVDLRLTGLREAWRSGHSYIYIGVGYNAYQFFARQTGLISDYLIHSRGGSDNSWLNLMITTGLLGSVMFIIPFLAVIQLQARHWLVNNRFENWALLHAIFVVFIQANFINSLFYSHLLLSLFTIAILIINRPHADHS